MLTNATTALLEYEVTPDATYLFVITMEQRSPVVHVFTIPVTATVLRQQVQTFRKAIATRDPDFRQSASELYRRLIAPARADLSGKHSLIIVPSGDLWHLPFQALQRRDGHYLIENATISYTPSLSVLRAGMRFRSVPAQEGTLLAMGNPQNDLPESTHEIRTIATLYGASRSLTFTGHEASVENFRKNAAGYDVVHLATHGVFDDRDRMYSHLLLATNAGTGLKSTDGQLDAAEIADMHLNARLVVLSACETADGKFQDGEGLIGLSWAFLAAGSRAAVASQWRVEATSTTALMIAFHRGLQQHLSTAEALRNAELKLSRNSRYQHPFYWAGFVLLGAS